MLMFSLTAILLLDPIFMMLAQAELLQFASDRGKV